MNLREIRSSVIEFTREQMKALLSISVIALGIAGFFFLSSRGEAVEIKEPISTPIKAEMVYVHVAGEVAKPGLYVLMKGARVADALAAAGGSTSHAQLEDINLARILNDGEQLLVPGIEKPTLKKVSFKNYTGMVNINRASIAQLDSLPGIGPVLAARIIEYRKIHGPFVAIEDLRKVRGIGARLFEEIKARLSL